MTQKSPYPPRMNVGHLVPVDEGPGAAPLFGIDAGLINITTFKLDDLTVDKRVTFGAATYIWAIDATSLTAEISIKFNATSNSAVPFKKGQAIGPLRFSDAFISHPAQAGETITFLTLRQGAEQSLLLNFINPSQSLSVVTFAKATVLDTVADVSCPNAALTSVLPANSTRRRALIQNLDAAAIVRIGDGNTTATRGFRLGPNELFETFSTEEIFVRNDSGAAVSVSAIFEAD